MFEHGQRNQQTNSHRIASPTCIEVKQLHLSLISRRRPVKTKEESTQASGQSSRPSSSEAIGAPPCWYLRRYRRHAGWLVLYQGQNGGT